MTTTSQRPDWFVGHDRRPALLAVALLVFGYVPLLFLGPGTDLDVGGVYDAGQSILAGSYEVSRTPGAPVFEAATAVLHAVGGIVLVNLASLAMAGIAALGVVRLLRAEGVSRAGWFGLLILVNPFVWIAGTSMVDFMWALALAVWGAHLQRQRQIIGAAVLYGLAAGCRLSTLALIAAFLLGDFMVAPPADRRRLALLGLGTIGLTAVVFLPPFLSLGRDFLRSDVPTSSVFVQIGRFGVKNAFFFGPGLIILLLLKCSQLWAGWSKHWGSSPVLRMATLGAIAGELLFLRYPWKLAHLLPVFVCVVLGLGAARVVTRPLLVGLLVSQLLLGVVNLNVAQPDQPDHATGGTFSPRLVEGPLISEIRCRLASDRDAYRGPRRDNAGGVGTDLLDTWACVVPWSE